MVMVMVTVIITVKVDGDGNSNGDGDGDGNSDGNNDGDDDGYSDCYSDGWELSESKMIWDIGIYLRAADMEATYQSSNDRHKSSDLWLHAYSR